MQEKKRLYSFTFRLLFFFSIHLLGGRMCLIDETSPLLSLVFYVDYR